MKRRPAASERLTFGALIIAVSLGSALFFLLPLWIPKSVLPPLAFIGILSATYALLRLQSRQFRARDFVTVLALAGALQYGDALTHGVEDAIHLSGRIFVPGNSWFALAEVVAGSLWLLLGGLVIGYLMLPLGRLGAAIGGLGYALLRLLGVSGYSFSLMGHALSDTLWSGRGEVDQGYVTAGLAVVFSLMAAIPVTGAWLGESLKLRRQVRIPVALTVLLTLSSPLATLLVPVLNHPSLSIGISKLSIYGPGAGADDAGGSLAIGMEVQVRNVSQYATTLSDFTVSGFLTGLLFQQFKAEHPALTLDDGTTACADATVQVEPGASMTFHLTFRAHGLNDEILSDLFRAIRRRQYPVAVATQADVEFSCPLGVLVLDVRDSQGGLHKVSFMGRQVATIPAGAYGVTSAVWFDWFRNSTKATKPVALQRDFVAPRLLTPGQPGYACR